MTTTFTTVEERIAWTASEDPSYQFVTLRPTSVTLSGGGGGDLALGETSTTAYRGDRGKTAYDHSQVVTGNPHGTTAADVGAQAADSDLTTIAGLTATTDSFMQAKAGAWSARTVAQVKADLGVAGVPQTDAARWSYGVPLGTPATTSAAYNADQIMAFWFELEPRQLDAIGLAVITNIASSYVRMGLYLPDDTGGKPGTLMVAHSGTVTTASTGHQSAAVSYTSTVLGCWAVVQVGGANGAVSRSLNGNSRRNFGGAAGDITDACQLRVGRVDAALPSSLAGTSWTYQTDTPHGMKVSYA